MRKLAVVLPVAIAVAQVASAHRTIPDRELSPEDSEAVNDRAQAAVPNGTIQAINAYGHEDRATWANVRYVADTRTAEYDLFLTVHCTRHIDAWECDRPEHNLAIRTGDNTWEMQFGEGVSPAEAVGVFDACWRIASTRIITMSRSGKGFTWFGSGLELPLPWEGTATLDPKPSCERGQ
jgi:hypothetical protein